jgi:hypothetical protein
MKKVIRLTESDLNRVIKESVNNILSEAGFFGGLRRAYNMGDTLDYLLSKDTRKMHQRGVDRDREKTGLGGRKLGLSGYYTKADRKKMQDEVDNINRHQADVEREWQAAKANTQRYYGQQRQQQEKSKNMSESDTMINHIHNGRCTREELSYLSSAKGAQWLGYLLQDGIITQSDYDYTWKCIKRGYSSY